MLRFDFALPLAQSAIRHLDQRRDVEKHLAEMVGRYRGLLEPIGNIPPAEAEERYYAALDQQPIAA